MTLSDVLGANAITLEHDARTFEFRPFCAADSLRWVETEDLKQDKNEPDAAFVARQIDAQLELMTPHFNRSLLEGEEVSAAWIKTQFPSHILGDLATFLISGKRPLWAAQPKK